MHSNINYCCKRFKQLFELNEIDHFAEEDETEWVVPNHFHLYYCPFCGTYIKGKGLGKNPVKNSDVCGVKIHTDCPRLGTEGERR